MSKQIYSDRLTRLLYANDASMYQQVPEAVAFPSSAEDVQYLLTYARENGLGITARTAGTSLAGQTVGSGLIADFSRFMNHIGDLDVNEAEINVQPGVIRDQLNRHVANHRLHFGPDTSTTNRCMIGGMIGNNSAGSYSIRYGSTRDHVKSLRLVLNDGSIAEFGPWSNEELITIQNEPTRRGQIVDGMIRLLRENREIIENDSPSKSVLRRNSGYALDRLLEMQPFNPAGKKFNLAEFFCGSEGTLALLLDARLKLVPKPQHSVLMVPQFSSLAQALRATVKLVKQHPSAVELLDDKVLEATENNMEQRENRFFIKGSPSAVLIVSFECDDLQECKSRAEEAVKLLKKSGFGYYHPILVDPDQCRRVWDLRKAGLGLLMGTPSDAKTPTFCEDTAVPVDRLPDYVNEFSELLERHKTDCVFYAHASVGELHLRPILNLRSERGLETMRNLALEIAQLVKKYRGSISGEHGDGRARSAFLAEALSSEMVRLFKQVKEIWDPENLFNPGIIVNAQPFDQHLRISSKNEPKAVETAFHWRREGGFGEAIESCNGAGVCRKLPESGGTMCPSYMATKDEKDSTRGRANVFRQLFAGAEAKGFSSEEIKEALDLCLGCKACKTECPASVDMAKMKAEFLNGWGDKNGYGFRDRMLASHDNFTRLLSWFPGATRSIVNSLMNSSIVKRGLSLSPQRKLPEFSREDAYRWFRKRDLNMHGENLLLFVDSYHGFHDTQVVKDAVKVLETLGYFVQLTGFRTTGRAKISLGMLRDVQAQMQKVRDDLLIAELFKMPVVGLEPSEVLTLRDEYLDLCKVEDLEAYQKIASQVVNFEEFITDRIHPKGLKALKTGSHAQVHIHPHCHAKALGVADKQRQMFEKLGFSVSIGDYGCCGMAGNFGYEEEHAEVSIKIAQQRFLPGLQAHKEAFLSLHGFSCRHQASLLSDINVMHPASIVAKLC